MKDAPAKASLRETLRLYIGLSRYEARVRYRTQALGWVWPFLQPLAMMGVLSMVLSNAFGGEARRDFPVYVVLGIVAWNFFSAALEAATASLIQRADVVRSTTVPRALLPLSAATSHLVNAAIESAAVLALVPIFPSSFRASPALFVVPAIALALLVIVCGVGLVTAALNVLYRDAAYLVRTALFFLFWMTPVVYPLDRVPDRFRPWVAYNPMTVAVEALRSAVMNGAAPSARAWVVMIVAAAASLSIGLAAFRRLEGAVLDRV
jgi:ABC-type polysaccharide/polyol phosphate export permease